MSGKPSRNLTFVLLFGPILLLTLSDLAYACTGSAGTCLISNWTSDYNTTISFSTKFDISI